ncbi:MAG: hypothetical protein JF886_16360 [Candidatus Dormibacteraeota bacterium]|uniref:Uncharacterized protein n=1 Tax=Candidatus Aeolococcus gillhamiae TaxID=3127015 RepID=A0A934K4V8_9BACT|nr:hypothetical protein [Candidatus Dormibacteraeota bacterium]
MHNPPETVQRQAELLAKLDPPRQALAAVPFVTGHGIGLRKDAFQRLRNGGGGPESVRPEDLVVTVTLATQEALERARPHIDSLLSGVPHEYDVGQFVPL